MRERELKPRIHLHAPAWRRSLPMRERELKHQLRLDAFCLVESLPMRERELKLIDVDLVDEAGGRSPCGSVN